MVLQHGTKVRRYATNLADRQYAINGRLEENPTAWRFVILYVDDDLDDAFGYLPRSAQPLIWQDHAKCIDGMAVWEVDSRAVVDKRYGQLSSAKFLILYSGRSSEEHLAERRRQYLDVHLPSLTKLQRNAFGVRLYVSNLVVREAEISDEHGPSASCTGGYLGRVSLAVVYEFWLDDAKCGDDFFSSGEAIGLLRDSPLGGIEVYVFSETIGFDRAGHSI